MKRILIAIPFMISIYFTYLVNRIWHFEAQINFMIVAFSSFTMCIIFYLFVKKIPTKRIKKKVRIVIAIFSIAISFLMLIINFDFLAKSYRTTTVIIDHTGKEAIAIRKILKDNVPQNLEKIEKVNHLALTFENCKDVVIVLEKGKTTGAVLIREGRKEKQVEWQNGIYVYQATEQKIMTVASIMRMVLSLGMIEILSYILCVSIYYLYKEKKSLLLPTLVVIVIIRIAFYQEINFNMMFMDSIDYQNHSFEELFSGKLQDRTPLYPLFIQFFISVCKESWKSFVCIAQIIISFLAVIYFYKTLRLIVKKEKLIAILTFLYGVSTAIMGWDTIILTESLALSTTVWFCYGMIAYLKTNQLKYGILSSILVFLMAFLKPALIGFVVIVFAFFLIKMGWEKEQRKKDGICLLIASVTLVFILGYATMFYQQYDIFSITKARVRQDLYVCMHQGFYKNSKDKQFIKEVEESIQTEKEPWNATKKILEKYGNKRVQELVKIAKKESKKEYIQYLSNLINSEMNTQFDGYQTLCMSELLNWKYNAIKSFSFLKFSSVYLILILEAGVSIFKWIKYRKIDWIHLGLFGFIGTMLFTSFVGTNAEFMRTAICVVPFSYMALGSLIGETYHFLLYKCRKMLYNRNVN